jgi:hypothetical protein
MSPVPAKHSCAWGRVTDNDVAAAAQLVDHLLTTVERMDVHVAEAADGVVETDAVTVSEPARYCHGPDGGGLLRSRCEPRKGQADAQFAAADVEVSERPASGSVADERLYGEGPDAGRVRDRDVMRLVFHFGSGYGRSPVLGRAVCDLPADECGVEAQFSSWVHGVLQSSPTTLRRTSAASTADF